MHKQEKHFLSMCRRHLPRRSHWRVIIQPMENADVWGSMLSRERDKITGSTLFNICKIRLALENFTVAENMRFFQFCTCTCVLVWQHRISITNWTKFLNHCFSLKPPFFQMKFLYGTSMIRSRGGHFWMKYY